MAVVAEKICQGRQPVPPACFLSDTVKYNEAQKDGAKTLAWRLRERESERERERERERKRKRERERERVRVSE